MGLKEELHKVEEMGHRRVLEDAIASDKHTIANGKAAEKPAEEPAQ